MNWQAHALPLFVVRRRSRSKVLSQQELRPPGKHSKSAIQIFNAKAATAEKPHQAYSWPKVCCVAVIRPELGGKAEIPAKSINRCD
jgi:hypothetical protein